jgi:hypothetical protein
MTRGGSAARQQCDVLLAPNVQHLGLLNWRAYDEAIKYGYDCTVAKIDRIKRHIADALTRFGWNVARRRIGFNHCICRQ